MCLFLDIFYSFIESGDTALDLGAGKGIQAQAMAERGASVLALEKMPMEGQAQHQGMRWKYMNIKDWAQDISQRSKFDFVLAKNILQFFPKEWVVDVLFPAMKNCVKIHGFIGIETFYRAPQPPFVKPHHSYWTVEEMKNIFSDWSVVFSNTSEEEKKDQGGVSRNFFISNIIVRS